MEDALHLNQSRCFKKPANVLCYFDKLQTWFRNPLSRITLGKLRKNCGKGGLYFENSPARFDWAFKQRVEFRQPDDCLLNWLAERDGALINRIEITLDLIFTCSVKRDDAFEFIDRHLIRRWHSHKHEVRIYRSSGNSYERVHIDNGQSRYDGGRWAPNSIVTYVEDFSRATGERFCLHHEWRARGVRAVRGTGISTAKDLVGFDYRKFWDERLLLADVQPAKIGALLRKRSNPDKNRERDARTGHVIISSVATMQELFDKYGSLLRLSRIADRIDHRHLLPPPRHTL